VTIMNDMQNEMSAKRYHETLRNNAPHFNYALYTLSEQAAKPWAQTTASHRRLLATSLGEVLAPFYSRIHNLESQLSRMQDELDEAKDIIRYGGTWTPNK
jgi:hypothetical protein